MMRESFLYYFKVTWVILGVLGGNWSADEHLTVTLSRTDPGRLRNEVWGRLTGRLAPEPRDAAL